MTLIHTEDKQKRKDMNEMNLMFTESLAEFLMGFRDEVVKALLANCVLEE